MRTRYNHQQVEEKWRKIWAEQKAWEVDVAKAKKPFYNLMMFPYPSAEGLHVGNVYAFTGSDIYGRFQRMRGFDVFEPMGFDAFGIHSENFAIKRGTHPKEQTERNVAHFTEQLSQMGAIFAWDHKVNTTDPSYYKWTQWLFLQLYKAGLAYRAKAAVDWCPSCKTVLADEQVVSGKCERCDSVVTQKQLEQWFFKITKYAERLLQNLKTIDWSERTKLAQKNWIGKSEGAELQFPLRRDGVTRYILLHGKGGSSQENFFPWLKECLEKEGYEVFALDLPNTEEPDDIEQTDFVEKHVVLDEHTVVVGHSFGGVVALRLLERGARVHSVVLVSTPFSGTYLDGKERPSVTAACKRGFRFDVIKENASSFLVLADTRDDVVPVSDLEAFASHLGARLVKTVARAPHFCQAQELVVLDAALPVVRVFTTRPDTLFGATYLVLAPEHELVGNLKSSISNWDEVEKYVGRARAKNELERTDLAKEKTGVELKGVKAVNPATKEEVPVFIADYVLASYGTGAIMAVPAHDERDFEFAKRYGLPMKVVVEPERETEGTYTGEGKMVNSGKFDGMRSEDVRGKIRTFVQGEKKTRYHMRDWLISRQRYWGPPIPIIYCETCGIVPVPEQDLPVLLPELEDFQPKGEGVSPLARVEEFVRTACPKCGKEARRETDVSDTFLDSAWYFLRYPSTGFDAVPFDKKTTKKWLPVDMYLGGQEHAVLHLLYARFITMALHDLGYLEFEEPFTKFRAHGLLIKEGAKMSKSKGNVVNPDEYFTSHGADTVRMYLMFLGPLSEGGNWSDKGIQGIFRFLHRVWVMTHEAKDTKSSLDALRNYTIKKATEDTGEMRYNTAIASLMEYSNEVAKEPARKDIETLLVLLAPFAPHITEELWEVLGNKGSVHNQPWPSFDEKFLKEEVVNMVVQVNGKVRDSIQVSPDILQEDAVRIARASEKVTKWLEGEPKQTIFVKGKLINFVS